MWWAINKKTGIKYGPYDDQWKQSIESTSETAGIYRFEKVPDPVPPPSNVKKAKSKRKTSAKAQD